MQSLTAYYYYNALDVQFNVDPSIIQRNRVVYQRTLKLYRGVDNIVRFTVKNSDQKPVNVTGWDVVFHIHSDNDNELLVKKTATVINAVGGVVTVTVSDADTRPLAANRYNYSLAVVDPLTGIEQVVYSDTNYGVRGQVELLDGHYPEVRESLQVTIPSNISPIITDLVENKVSTTSHTFQYWFNDFTGTIAIQATLDALPAGGQSNSANLSWSTVASTYYENQSTSDYKQVTGHFTALRVEITDEFGSVTKILYRP